jgi:hypothetical protein
LLCLLLLWPQRPFFPTLLHSPSLSAGTIAQDRAASILLMTDCYSVRRLRNVMA